jgi:chromosome partitioning protein
LVIDLDPQTNATICLITQEHWQDVNKRGQTIYNLFNNLLNRSEKEFSIQQSILQDVGGIKGLDLLPSSLDLVEIQDEIPSLDQKRFVSHVDIVQNSVIDIKDKYKYIIIDCPPNLGAITLNGISMSNYYVVPTVPDILSKMGLSMICNRIKRFKQDKRSCKIELGGIIFTKVDDRTNLHTSTKQQLRQDKEWKGLIFDAELPQRVGIAEAPRDNRPFITSQIAIQRKDYGDVLQSINRVTDEFLRRIEKI